LNETTDVIAIFAALQLEVEACLSSLSPVRETNIGPFTVLQGDLGFVCRTGVGRVAEDATERAIAELEPRYLLSVGTAGGLNREFETADLVLCDSLQVDPA
jgi:nucleoside phosphorylase